MDNYGHIYEHKYGLTGCRLKDKGICRSPVKKINRLVDLVKSYGQNKTDTDYLAIPLVFCPNFRPKKWKPALIARSEVGV